MIDYLNYTITAGICSIYLANILRRSIVLRKINPHQFARYPVGIVTNQAALSRQRIAAGVRVDPHVISNQTLARRVIMLLLQQFLIPLDQIFAIIEYVRLKSYFLL